MADPQTEFSVFLCDYNCKHGRRWDHAQRRYIENPKKCHLLGNALKKLWDNGGELDNNLYDTIIKKIENSKDYYSYGSSKCIDANRDIPLYLKKFFSKGDLPSDNILRKIVGMGKDYGFIMSIMKNKNFTHFSVENIDYIYKTFDRNVFMGLLDKGIELNDESLSLLLIKENIQDMLLPYLKRYVGEVKMEHLYKSCQILPNSKEVVLYLIGEGLNFDDQCINIVCQYGNKEAIEFIFSHTKAVPTEEHFNTFIAKNNRLASYQKKEALGVFIKWGYMITQKDLEITILQKIEIPGLDRFDLKLGAEVLELCSRVNFYPNNYKFESGNMVKLHALCRHRDKTRITKFITQHNLKPDTLCLRGASDFKQNVPTVRMLIEKGAKADLQCVKNSAKWLTTNGTLELVLESYEANIKEQIENYEKQIKSMATKVEELEKELDETKKGIANQKDAINQKTEIKDKKDDIELIDEESEEEEDEVIIVGFPKDIMKRKPKNIRKKDEPPKLFSKYFSIKGTNKMSFLDLKKELLFRIKKNKWVNEKNGQLIEFPKDFKKTFKLDEGYVHFSDLDKLVCTFY